MATAEKTAYVALFNECVFDQLTITFAALHVMHLILVKILNLLQTDASDNV